MKKLSYIPIVVLFTFLTTIVLKGQINYGLIPQSCQVDWTNAGLLPNTPTTAKHLFNVVNYGAVPNDGQDDYSGINSAIEAAKNSGNTAIVYFLSGYYKITSTIDLSRMCLQNNKIT